MTPKVTEVVPNAPESPQGSPAAATEEDGVGADVRRCEECDAAFTSRHPRKRFCSDLCKDRLGHRRRYGATPHVRPAEPAASAGRALPNPAGCPTPAPTAEPAARREIAPTHQVLPGAEFSILLLLRPGRP